MAWGRWRMVVAWIGVGLAAASVAGWCVLRYRTASRTVDRLLVDQLLVDRSLVESAEVRADVPAVAHRPR